MQKISTPKELMISRYNAFVEEDWEYIAKTSTSQTIEELQNTPRISWLKLEVLTASDDTVEFKAYYILNDRIELLHEKSTFVFINDEWKYQDGVLYDTQIAKNEICFCGSKKKYKRCCYIPD